MSVAVNTNGELRSLNRLQPVDPAYVQSWATSLTGDGTSGVAEITCDIPQDHAFILLWFSGVDGAATLALQINVNPGIDVQGTALNENFTAEVVTAVSGNTRFHWEPGRVLYVPDPGSAGAIRLRWPNPGVATLVEGSGQAYLWPVNEVRSLSPRQLWYFLQH